MKRIKFAALFILSVSLSLLLISCQSTVEGKNGDGAVFSYGSYALSTNDMEKDYTTMWRIIENNYPYMHVAERTTKKDFKKVKEDYRNKLQSIKNDREFGELIKSCLGEFQGCGHMRMLSSDGEYAGYLDGYKEAGKNSRHCKLIYDTLNNNASRAYYSYKGNSNKGTGETTKGGFADTINNSIKRYDEIGTAYVKIPSFGYEGMKAGLPALKKYFQGISGLANCIIDIRGNGGGSDSFWMQGIVEPNLKKELINTYYMLVKGPESEKYVKSDMPLFPISELDVSSMPKLKAEDLGEMAYFCKSSRKWSISEEPVFKGDFYILTNRQNYSAAESFVIFCKSTGFAVLVGDTTGGDGIGMDPMISVLPRSGICFRFSVLYGLNPDGGSNEECGTEPDIPCNGEDALTVCLKHIREKNP
jgi:hypothetical protein